MVEVVSILYYSPFKLEFQFGINHYYVVIDNVCKVDIKIMSVLNFIRGIAF